MQNGGDCERYSVKCKIFKMAQCPIALTMWDRFKIGDNSTREVICGGSEAPSKYITPG